VDIGAGDGWWTERLAKCVGPKGVVYALEVEEKKVTELKKKYADTIQIKPYLAPTDRTALPENSCDLIFFSQVYHHLDPNGHVDYLKHLRHAVRPTGRLVVIEKYSKVIATSGRHGKHGTRLSQLIRQAEEAGWIPVRCELLTGTYHYMAIFVQKDLFPPIPKEN
jgi:predicted methyltransferase